MNSLKTIPEAAPWLKKTEGAARWWLAQPDCPIKVVRIGRRVFVRETDLEALVAGELQQVS